MARVLVTRQLPEGGLVPLVAAGHEIVLAAGDDDTPLTPDELLTAAAEADGIVCALTDRIDAALLAARRDCGSWPTWRSATTTST